MQMILTQIFAVHYLLSLSPSWSIWILWLMPNIECIMFAGFHDCPECLNCVLCTTTILNLQVRMSLGPNTDTQVNDSEQISLLLVLQSPSNDPGWHSLFLLTQLIFRAHNSLLQIPAVKLDSHINPILKMVTYFRWWPQFLCWNKSELDESVCQFYNGEI